MQLEAGITRECAKCKIVKPMTEYDARSLGRPDRQGSSVRLSCRDCVNNRYTKFCVDCGVAKIPPSSVRCFKCFCALRSKQKQERALEAKKKPGRISTKGSPANENQVEYQARRNIPKMKIGSPVGIQAETWSLTATCPLCHEPSLGGYGNGLHYTCATARPRVILRPEERERAAA